MAEADGGPGQAKGRSASICAPGFSSMEQVLTAGVPVPGTPPADGGGRRRRPAARSQSARLTGGKSVRRRHPPAHPELGGSNHSIRSGSSEPRLSEVSSGQNESPSPGGFRRKGSTQRRVNSVYQRKSTAFLDVPSDKHSQAQEPMDEDSYRLRSFSFTSKGVVNRGDSFRRRRSRSNSLLPPTSPSPAEPPSTLSPVPSPEVISYRVAMLGAAGVGKTALVSQFMTSECINAYDRSRDDGMTDGVNEQAVCIMLNGEESELKFINIGNEKGEIDKSSPPADAYVVMYSVIDKASFQRAEDELGRLQDYDMLRARPAILVANKVDLARSRAVSSQDGKCLACTYRAKFVEISVGINHNVDELLVGILTQIRMKRANANHESSSHWYKSRGMVRASMKARQMFTWIFGKEDSKFKNCENLHVL